MKLYKLIGSAGLALAVGSFASLSIAQSGGASAPGAASNLSTMNQAPALGEPGTEAPASSAPIGAAESQFMIHSGREAATAKQPNDPQAIHAEEKARTEEVRLQRDIVTARARGANITAAQHQKWLGSIALAKGDRIGAMRYFSRGFLDLRDGDDDVAKHRDLSAANDEFNTVRDTDQTPNGVNMNPNTSARMPTDSANKRLVSIVETGALYA